MKLPIYPLISLLAVAISHPGHADIYVRNFTTGSSGDGTSWGSAFVTIEEALAVAVTNGGDTIHVAGGIYFVGGRNITTDPTATFTIPPNTTILGGYNSNGNGVRSIIEFPTIISGDIGRDDERESLSYVIEHFNDQRGTNVHHAVTIPDGDVTISGCVITAGNASGTTGVDRLGGGILMLGNSLTLDQCRLAGNIARFGGALACNSADELIIDRCNFSGNSAIDHGACAFLQNITAPVIFSNCALSDSSADSGGAIYSKNNQLRLLNATVSRNAASLNGGAVACVDGTELTLTNSIIWNNLAAGGRTSQTASVGLSSNSTFTHSYCFIENVVGKDPLFIEPPNYWRTPSPGKDLELSPLSSAIDAGNNAANLSPLDLNASNRISQSAIDIGAYERQKGADRYVDASVGTSGDGSSWAAAYKTLYEALVESEPGESVFVAEGIYYPDDSAPVGQDRNYEFEIPPGVTVAGGFPSGGGVQDRDSALNPTILSGDIDNNDINFDGNFIPEDSAHVVGNNTYNVVKMFNTTEFSFTTSLVGFTVTGGVADNLAADLSSANEEAYGGGIYSYLGGTVIIDDCRIVHNQARSGGGIYIREALNATISNCYIGNNTATVEPTSGPGGIYLHASPSVAIRNCLIEGNSANQFESALRCLTVEHLVIEDTVIANHTGSGPASNVLGFTSSGNVSIIRTSICGNAVGERILMINGLDGFDMRESLVAGNHLSEPLSAVLTAGPFSESMLAVSLTNCTIAGNRASSMFAKLRSSDTGTLSLGNCVLTDTPFEASSDALSGVNVFRTHSLIKGFAADADGNLDEATLPGFADPQSSASAPTTAGNYALLVNSPLIEAGLNTATTSLLDITGSPRLFDADDDGTARVDIGAYEYPIVIPPPPVLEVITASFNGARGLTTIEVQSNTAGDYRAEYSIDLQTWLPAATGFLAVGSNTIRIPGAVYAWPEDRVYFRVVLE